MLFSTGKDMGSLGLCCPMERYGAGCWLVSLIVHCTLVLFPFRSLCAAIVSCFSSVLPYELLHEASFCFQIASCKPSILYFSLTSTCILRVFHPSSRAFVLPLLISKREGKLINCVFYHRTPKFMN